MATYVLKRLGYISTAKFFALFGLVWGVLNALFVFALGAVFSALASQFSGIPAVSSVAQGALSMTAGVAVGSIILGLIGGFIVGLVFVLVYNVIAMLLGGMKVDLEQV